MGTIFIIGTAGSGKTELTASLASWFKEEGERVATVNMDPGVASLPYEPDVDVREYIDLAEIMERFKLGPNGGLLVAMDLIANYIEKINHQIWEMKPNYVIVDTPGQMEIFAYRAGGLFVSQNLISDEKIILFLFDGVFCKHPRNFVATALLSASVNFRFSYPLINVLNKIDLLTRRELRRELLWSRRPSLLARDLAEESPGEESAFFEKISEVIHQHIGKTDLIPVSSITLSNFSNLIAGITRVLFRGEERLNL